MKPPEPEISSEADRELSRLGSVESFLLLGTIALYLFISLRNLDVIPPVYEDEPWQASTAWKIATQGILGSDMFAGFYGMERHYYGFMPLNPLLTSLMLRVSGLGLLQVRLTSVVLGLLVLLLTYSLGRRLFNSQVGLLAIIFLLFVSTSSTTRFDPTGIPLLDITRIHRYDPAVAVFGLSALHAYISARSQGKLGWYLLAGFLAGLSGLAHLYGTFWLFVLLLLALVERVALKYFLALILGFCLPWLPYILYITPNFIDWRGQTQFYAERFELLDPAWYWHNLTSEDLRYRLVLLPLSKATWFEIGNWAALLAVPISIAGLGWHALRRKDQSASRLFVPVVILPFLFALLISLKYRNYTITLLPLAALAAAWGGWYLWKAAEGRAILKSILLLFLAAVLVGGASRVVAMEVAARESTPYPSYIARVRAKLPAEARVLGLQRYWIGLHDLDYHSWLVPIYQAHDIYQPLSIEAALEQLDPDVILIDPAMRAYFANAPDGDDLPERIYTWMEQQGFRLSESLNDSTYGKIEVFLGDIY